MGKKSIEIGRVTSLIIHVVSTYSFCRVLVTLGDGRGRKKSVKNGVGYGGGIREGKEKGERFEIEQ